MQKWRETPQNKCIHRQSDGVCELTGRQQPKDTCVRWRCRSYKQPEPEPAKAAESQPEAKEQIMGQWRTEYGKTRATKTYTSTDVKARYNAKNYDRLTVTLPKGSASLLRRKAEEQGCSVNRLLTEAITAAMPDCIAYNGGGGVMPLQKAWELLKRIENADVQP